MNYASYLRLDELLELQSPVGAPANGHQAELFFIVAHQAAELWLKSVLLELEAVDRALVARQPASGAPLVHARRALAGVEALVAGVEALRALDGAAFFAFRDRLTGASGAQSAQFARLRALVGLDDAAGGPIEAHLREALAADVGEELAALVSGRASGPWYWLVDTLMAISSGMWRWGMHHLDVAQRLIGRLPGTGGADVSYLAARALERPFPTLWRALPGRQERA